MRYGGSNPPLCTILFAMQETDVELKPAGNARLGVALAGFAALAALAWWTMEPGKFRSLTWVLLGFFAVRVVLTHLRSR